MIVFKMMKIPFSVIGQGVMYLKGYQNVHGWHTKIINVSLESQYTLYCDFF